jgi:SHS2 domain-containing protein
MKTFERIDHAADIGLRAFGRDMKELFTNAASGMMSLLLDDARVSGSAEKVIELQGRDLQELLVNLLEEILFLLNVRGFVTASTEIQHLDESGLRARLAGEALDDEKHRIKYDIKGVTFHQLRFEEEGGLIAVKVIFDV